MRTALALVLVALASPGASAAPPVAAVEGEIALPDGGVKQPDVEYPGFVDRIPNPITEIRQFDPRPEVVVVLEGGPVDAEGGKPESGAVTWELGPHAFGTPIVAVALGQRVDIKNRSKGVQHPLYSPNYPDLVSKDPIGPGGVRTVEVKEPHRAIVIRSQDLPHLEGRIVAFPTRYFATLDRRDPKGKYRIENVPSGKWTVRIWYRDGWLPTQQVVEVGTKGTTTVPRITLPQQLEPKAPAQPPAK